MEIEPADYECYISPCPCNTHIIVFFIELYVTDLKSEPDILYIGYPPILHALSTYKSVSFHINVYISLNKLFQYPSREICS